MSENNTNHSKASNNDEESTAENLDSVHLDLCKIYNEIVETLVKTRHRFPLTIGNKNETSRDNLLSYLALRRYNLEGLQAHCPTVRRQGQLLETAWRL